MRAGGAPSRAARAHEARDPTASPRLTVIAGANGAGKSTYSTFLRHHHAIVIDPDAIAKEIDPANPTAVRVAAARLAIARARGYLEAGETFGIETTLAGSATLRLMADARGRGYGVDLIYLGTSEVQINIARIANRVAHGGHGIPTEDVLRRYDRSFLHLPEAAALADGVVLIDNSGDVGYDLIARRDGVATTIYRDLPKWVREAGVLPDLEDPELEIDS